MLFIIETTFLEYVLKIFFILFGGLITGKIKKNKKIGEIIAMPPVMLDSFREELRSSLRF